MFNLFGLSPAEGHERQRYHERKILPYRQRELYDLVADVDAYHRFVPYCTASRVLTPLPARGDAATLDAELTVGFMGFEESYVSRVECRPYEMVQAVASAEIHLFKSLVTTWRFQPAPATSVDGPTLLTFDIEYAFANALHAQVSSAFFGQVSKMMMRAFEERCVEVYGPGDR